MKRTLFSMLLIGVCQLFCNNGFSQTNIAQGKATKMASIDGGYEGAFAVDGTTEFDADANTDLCKTYKGQYQWVQIDLGARYAINSIKFYCPEEVKTKHADTKNDGLILVVSDDPTFKNIYNPGECRTFGLATHSLQTARFGLNITQVPNLEGRYLRIWDTYINGITTTEIEVYGTLAKGAVSAAIKSGNEAEAQTLLNERINQGGSVDQKELLQLAIDQNSDDMVRTILDNDNSVPDGTLDYAMQRKVDSKVINQLLSADIKVSGEAVNMAIQGRDATLVNKMLTKDKTAFRSTHVEAAFLQGQSDMGMSILEKTNLKPSTNVLRSVVNSGDMLLASRLMTEFNAKGDAGMLNTAITQNDSKMTGLLLKSVRPNSESFVIAARNGDKELFSDLTAQANLPDNRAVNVAIDNGNTSILKTALRKGGNVNEGLDYAIQKNNAEMIAYLAKQSGADANKAIPFAVTQNDKDLFNAILNEYGGDPDKGLKEAVQAKKTSLALLALETGNTNPSPFVEGAVKDGDDVLAKALVDFGGDPNLGMKPAIEKNNVVLVEHFLSYEASVSDPKLLELAAARNIAITTMLVEKGADPNNGMLGASGAGKLVIVKYLLEQGGDANRGMTAAAMAGHRPVLQALLDAGGEPDKGIKAAIEANQSSCTLLLLEAGADASVPTYIATAAGKDNLKVVESLVNYGADPNNGLGYAVHYKADRCLKFLVEQGGDLNDPKYMEVAVKQGSAGAIPLIVEAGVDVNQKNPASGNTYLHNACAESSTSGLLLALLQAGADPNLQNNKGDVALHVLARRGKDLVDLVPILADAGADLNIKNSQGDTPRKVAKGTRMKRILKDLGADK